MVEPGCRFGAAFDLVYDRSGLVLTYPGLAVRADGETTDRALPDSM
ncbi:MAG TPA: hypothetical protein VJ804_15835 [Acidimicrobiales bacterium]|nr:hypothetical protein [Acidimicrobiales bacterium]